MSNLKWRLWNQTKSQRLHLLQVQEGQTEAEQALRFMKGLKRERSEQCLIQQNAE